MKKTLLLILCVSLLQIYVPVFAAESTDVSYDSIGILRAAGIIDSTEQIVPENGITRGDFVSLASRIALHGNFAKGTSVLFSDVNSQDKNFEAINLLSSMNIISGNEDGIFKPNERITHGEAANIIINSMSGDECTVNDKNSLTEYFSAAVRNKLLRNIDTDIEAKMTWADTANLFMNVLSSNVCVQVKFGDKAEYKRYSDVTYFNMYFDVYNICGRVTDNGVTSLSGKSKISDDSLLIGETLLTDSREKKTDLLGMEVDAYYKHTKGKNAELIYATGYDEQVLTLTSNMIYSYKDNVYHYGAEENDEYKYTAKLLPEFDLIYNGKAVLQGEKVDLNNLHPESGRVELIDSDGDSRYETVKLWVYRTAIVSSKDEERFMIYDKLGGMPFVADEADGCIITDKDGNTMSFAQIQPMDVLSVAVSLDGECNSIICNKSGFNARIDEYINESIYLLSGAEYRPSSDFSKVYKAQLKIGTYADFYANHEGLLVYMDTSSEPRDGLAYLVDAVEDKNGFGSNYLVKLFTSNGKMRVYSLAERVTVDGIRDSSQNAYNMLFENGSVKQQLLDYNLDGEERISVLDLAYDGTPGVEESAYSLHRHGANSTKSMTFLSNTFDGKILTNASTKVFLIPNDGNEEAFKVTDQSYFHNVSFVIDAYRHDPDSALAEAIVMKLDYTGRKYSYPFRPASLVKSVRNAVDAEGNVVQKLVCYENGSEVTVYTEAQNVLQVESEGRTIEFAPGDIIRYGTNIKGVIDKGNVVLLYDADNDDYAPVSQGSYTGSFFMYMGYAYGRDDTILRVSPQAAEIGSEQELYNYDISVGKIVVVTKNKDGYSFRIGTKDDILDYKSVGTDCSRIFVYTWSTKPRMIVIYE